MFGKLFTLIAVFSMTFSVSANQRILHHDLTVRVDPASHFVEVVDTVILPETMVQEGVHFLLIKDLQVESLTQGVEIRPVPGKISRRDFGMDVEDFSETPGFSLNKFRVLFKKDVEDKGKFTLRLRGKIHYDLQRSGEEYERGFSRTPGIISGRGVYLAGSSFWVPWFSKDLITYEMEVSVPEPWDVVSHGKRTKHEKEKGKRVVRWRSLSPTQEIFLIAARFHQYAMKAGSAEIMAFLRAPDVTLANKYLETTAQYMEMYCKLIGPFPYSKFALVENFWETGYGMPSFTLLGPRIIRFPFILHSSYPHELLHNYWGNSVFVDFEKGNWCEGITVYMADHLIKEQRGQGANYRRDKLQRYTDYVTPENDFPLTRFLSRNNASTEAVGYGKSMMVMEMLREKVGDDLFIKGFQVFYRNNRFKTVGFDEIRVAFESVTGESLEPFFDQWIKRAGAPELRINNVSSRKEGDEYQLNFTLIQIQDGESYRLEIPLAISFTDGTRMKKVMMSGKKQSYSLSLKQKPLMVQVDPRFNLFRRLHYSEIPPAFSRIFGSGKILIVLPAKADAAERAAYRKLAEMWSGNKGKDIIVKSDSEIKQLPAHRDVWVFGRRNRFRGSIIEGIRRYGAHISDESIRFGDTPMSAGDRSFVVTARHPANNNAVLAWLAIGNPESLDALARKLMHYGKYSYLAFEGKEAVNTVKGQWKAVDSPMVVELEKNGSKKTSAPLPKRKPLAVLAPVFSADRMMDHIRFLASDRLKGRGLGTPEIHAASEYIAGQFKQIGLRPGGDGGSWFQTFNTEVDGKGDRGEVRNVIGYIPGTDPKFNGESVVVSAHYDHLGLGWPDVKRGNRGKIHNGADDNASGIAVMVELAGLIQRTVKPRRAIVFAAFTAEENGMIGSRFFVENWKKFPAGKVIGNINLDTVGRLFDNQLMVLDGGSAREWKFIFMGAGYVTGVPSRMVSGEITASDQKSFIEKGIPAVQLFSGAHGDYHTPEDDLSGIDAAGLVKVASFAREGILYLAGRDQKLHFTGKIKGKNGKSEQEAPKKKGERRASTGVMPDFGFPGAGVRAATVRSGSPADQAGIQKGDVLIRLGKYPARTLREYAGALRNFSPGEEVVVTYIRDGRECTARVLLAER